MKSIENYWLLDQTWVVCGCFKGDLIDFEDKVKETHGTNEHAEQYYKEIKKVRYLIESET